MRWVAYLAVWVGVIAGLVQALDTNVDFEVTFDIDRENGQVATGVQFRTFLTELRHQAADRDSEGHHCLVGQTPVLPQQSNDVVRFFDIVLRSVDGMVRLRFRRDSFYLIGHRIELANPEENKKQKWWECRPDAVKDKKGKETVRQPWIAGAGFLEFGENYSRLERFAGGAGREKTPIGMQPLRESVRVLAKGTSGQQQGNAYLVLAQMLAEAARFTDILDHVVEHWDNPTPPTADMVARENAWSSASSLLLEDPAHARAQLATPVEQGGIRIRGVTTLASLVQFIALLLRVNPANMGGNGKLGRRSKGGQCKAPAGGWAPQGKQLFDILSIKTSWDSHPPKKYELYGKVWTSDATFGRTNIYHVDVSDSHGIAAGNGYNLPLDFGGQMHALSAQSHVTVGFELQRYDIPFGDKISTGEIEWDAFNNAGVNVYDQILTQAVAGETGLAEMEYIVFSNAVEAHVEVIVINGDDDPAQVFGRVTASYPMPRGAPSPSKAGGADAHENDGKTMTVDLLPKDVPYHDVKKGEKVRLRKPFVVVPWAQELTIDIDLWDHNTITPNHQIGLGKVTFAPEFEKSSTQTIKVEKGAIEIRITWV
ncbi:Ricin [Orbilia brochopaga]|nr:Ricin [Drechslerella brochopaga]